jgi:photosystem II stability/assembly factor-like uncharacterized protein
MSKGTSLAKLICVIAILVLPLVASGADKSCWLSDAASPAPSVAYLLCEQGAVFTTTDGGTKFSSVDTGIVGRHLAMAFTDLNHGLIVGDAGMVLATEDGAKTWKPRESGTKEHLRAICNVGEAIWVAGFDGVLIHSSDGGKTWEKQKSGTSQTLEGIYFLDPNHGWAVGWAGTILRTSDGGKKWTEVKSEAASWSLSSVYFRDLQNGWTMGFSGQLLRSRDGGATWVAQIACDNPATAKPGECTPVKSWLTSVAFERGNRAWITADDQFLMSEDGGEKWKAVDYAGQLYMRRFLPVGDVLWAVGQLGVLKQVGAEWKPVESLVVGSAAIMNLANPTKKKDGPSE